MQNTLAINKIDKSEVLRYLGYKNENAETSMHDTVDECIDLIIKTVKPRYLVKYVDISIDAKQNAVFIKNSSVKFTGTAICNHLDGCEKAVLICATLSVEADKLIRLEQLQDVMRGLVVDCCASEAIEQLCNSIEEEIRQEQNGLYSLTSRFSPGYGDLPLEVQKDFLSLLDAQKRIGLYSTSESILTPRKSVTAIIGLYDFNKKRDIKVDTIASKCDSCNMRDKCKFRKGGGQCGL